MRAGRCALRRPAQAWGQGLSGEGSIPGTSRWDVLPRPSRSLQAPSRARWGEGAGVGGEGGREGAALPEAEQTAGPLPPGVLPARCPCQEMSDPPDASRPESEGTAALAPGGTETPHAIHEGSGEGPQGCGEVSRVTLGFESGPLEVSSVSRGRWWDLVDTRHRFPNTVRESHRTSAVAGISARLQAGRPPLPWERGCSRKHPRAPWLSAGIEPEETEGTRSPSAPNRRGAEAKRSLCGRTGLGAQRWTLAAGGGGGGRGADRAGCEGPGGSRARLGRGLEVFRAGPGLGAWRGRGFPQDSAFDCTRIA